MHISKIEDTCIKVSLNLISVDQIVMYTFKDKFAKGIIINERGFFSFKVKKEN